jgi:hypothetical protein
LICENAAAMAEPFVPVLCDRQPASRPKVIFVMGAGHSGSTILGVALGNCEDMFYAGELDNWLIRSGTPVLGGAGRVRFWNTVRAQVPDASELFGGECKNYLERSLAQFRLDWRSARHRLRPRYRRVTEELYHAIAGVAGVRYVVDSSHFPMRARELQGLPGIDLHLVYLIRDPQSVVESFNLHVNRHDSAARWLRTLDTNADLWMTHLLSVFVFMRQPRERRLLLRHEDFLADPEGVLRQLLDGAGSGADVPDLASLKTGFPLFGNRLIKSETVAFKRRARRPRRRSRVTALLQLPWSSVHSRLGPTPSVGAG